MIKCNESFCDKKCKKSLHSNCVILEGDICFLDNSNVSSNSCNDTVTLTAYVKALCLELERLKRELKCMTDIYCAPHCELVISEINLTN